MRNQFIVQELLKVRFKGILAGALMAATLPAIAQTQQTVAAPDLPSAVWWLGGIAAFLGFLLGSVPFHEEDYGWKFDTKGAFLWAFAGGAVVGGLTYLFEGGSGLVTIVVVALGALSAVSRVLATRPARMPTKFQLAEGVNRIDGSTPSAKYKAATKMYKNAAFTNGSYYASRGIDWTFGKEGLSDDVKARLAQGLRTARSNVFAILVVLVRELPGESNQPAVLVVSSKQFGLIQFTNGGVILPGCDKEIPNQSIAGLVGYSWR
jgi:hypothetical protein